MTLLKYLYKNKGYKINFNLKRHIGIKIESIDREKSTSEILVLKEKDKDDFCYIGTEYLESIYDKIANKPEILYVGYSLEILRRLKNHEKIIKILSSLDDDHELRIFLNSIRYSFLNLKDNGELSVGVNDLGLNKERIEKDDFKDLIKLSERILIHYFQPKFNNDHINLKLETDPLVKKLLKKHEITIVGAEYGMGNNFFDFWSKNQKTNSKMFLFDTDEPEKGYQKLTLP